MTQLTDHLAANTKLKVSLISQRQAGQSIFEADSDSLVQRSIVSTSSRMALAMGLPVASRLRDWDLAQKPHVVHGHGLWHAVNHWTAGFARANCVPLLIHTRGMLEAWALAYRGRKKRAALALYQRRDLETASLFFATAEAEAESIRNLGLKQPIAIIPNGVDLPPGTIDSGSSSPKGRHMKGRHIKNALFLSRIHPKKGLINLLEAWARVRPAGWCLRIAGPDENDHLREVMKRVDTLALGSCVEYLGSVEGEAKAALFSEADVFVLPSFSENFGVVVAEALSYGVPVITTHGTPWKELESRRCGWWVEPTQDGIAGALHDAINLDRTTMRQMAANGREYASNFDWTGIAQQTADVYRWILGKGSEPNCVIQD